MGPAPVLMGPTPLEMGPAPVLMGPTPLEMGPLLKMYSFTIVRFQTKTPVNQFVFQGCASVRAGAGGGLDLGIVLGIVQCFFHLRRPMTQFNFVCGFACCWAVRLFACLFCCSAFVGCFAVLIPFLLSVVWPVVVLFACCLAVMLFCFVCVVVSC